MDTEFTSMQSTDTITVAGISLYNNTVASAVELVVEECGLSRENRCISATGAHGIVYARQNREFRDLLQAFWLNLPDGMPTVWVGRIKGAHRMRRCYGPDFFAEMMRRTAGTGIRHFLCGGNDGIADKLKTACGEKFDNKDICGTFTPPFLALDEYDYEGIAGRINESGADIVWIGLGAPKQEQFAARLSAYTDTSFIITVGAAFDFHTGGVRQAPLWVQNAGLEWLFRLLIEPRRLWRRYLEIIPLYFWYSMEDLVRFKVGRFKMRRRE